MKFLGTAVIVMAALVMGVGGVPVELHARQAAEDEVGPGSWHRGAQPREIGLDEAVSTALLRSPVLHAAETRVDAATSRRREAYGRFLPSVGLGYAYVNSSTGRLDPTGQEITNTSWSTQLTASYDVFSGFSGVTGAQAAGRRALAEEARYDEAREQARLDTKVAWFDAVAAGETVRVEASRVARQRSQLELVELQLEMGRVARTDALRAEVALNTAMMALIRARSAARAADFALSRTLGLEEPVTPRRDEVGDPVPLGVGLDELLTAAQADAPLLRGAAADLEAARAEVNRARSSYFPSLSIQGGWAWSDSEFPPSRGSWRVGVSGGVPLFNGFSRETRVDEAQASSRAAAAGQRLAELQIAEDVAAAFDLVGTALQAVQLADRTVELASEELEMQRERFRLGRGALFEVQEAEAGLAQAEADRVRARFDYHTGRAQLEYLIGMELTELEPSR